MSQLLKNEKLFYQIMEGSRYLLADERNKKKLLDLLFETRKIRGWRTCAFCVTDESAYFITEAREGEQLRKETEIAAGRFLQECVAIPVCGREKPGWVRLRSEEILYPSELPGLCRAIHRIPLERGYVSRICDYWWSSYNTYAGVYRWETVDCRKVYVRFSVSREVARRRFIRFHKQ